MFLRLMAILVGAAVVAGAVASWHYWNVAGGVAVVAAIFGSIMIEHGVTGDSSSAEQINK